MKTAMTLLLPQLRAAAAAIVAAAGLAACAPSFERTPVPIDQIDNAQIPNMPGVRYWADSPPSDLDAIIQEITAQREAAGMSQDLTYLALSGGGEDGAFGAGILSAWSQLGTRPEFDVVTGVSTGALTAPFAFLGPDYDDALRQVYGGFPPEDIYRQRSIFSILPSVSVADSVPLANIIAEYADEDLLAAVAREHRRGRRLLVQSTHLDAQRPVLWDMGAIASSGAPNALQVFRDALLASASIPVAFPPMIVTVEANGQTYDELHVDGGTVSEDTVLLGWQAALSREVDPRRRGKTTFYVLRNGYIDPEYKTTEYSLLGIGGSAISTLLKAQGTANLLGAYEAARIRGAEFRVTWIREDFQTFDHDPFDPTFMNQLFDYGFERMMKGDVWEETLPFLAGEGLRASDRALSN